MMNCISVQGSSLIDAVKESGAFCFLPSLCLHFTVIDRAILEEGHLFSFLLNHCGSSFKSKSGVALMHSRSPLVVRSFLPSSFDLELKSLLIEHFPLV